jgi:hypothetical protein
MCLLEIKQGKQTFFSENDNKEFKKQIGCGINCDRDSSVNSYLYFVMSESYFFIENVLEPSSYFRKILALFSPYCSVLDVWGKVPKDASAQL